MNEVQEAGFLDALKEDPYDEATHRAYADWLDENGMDDESLIHREWSVETHRESETWLRGFVKKINDEYNDDRDLDWDYCGTGLDRPYRELITYDQLLEKSRESLDNRYSYDIHLPFQTPDFIDDDREQFWRHIATVLWITVPEDKTFHMPFTCSC